MAINQIEGKEQQVDEGHQNVKAHANCKARGIRNLMEEMQLYCMGQRAALRQTSIIFVEWCIARMMNMACPVIFDELECAKYTAIALQGHVQSEKLSSISLQLAI